MNRRSRETQGTYTLVFPENMGTAPEEKRDERSWFANVLLIHFVFALIAYPCYLGYRLAMPRVNQWRANQLAQTAAVAIQAGNFGAAADEIERAIALSRDCPALLRAQALYYSHFGNPQGLIYWRRWDDSGLASRADKLAFTRLALTCLRVDIARRVLKPLHLADPTNPEILALVSEIFALSGDREQALSAIKDALTRDPENQEYEIQLGVLELRNRSAETRALGKARLFGLISHLRSDRSPIARRLLLEGNLSAAEDRLLVQLLGPPRTAKPYLGEDLIRLAVELRKRPDEPGPVLEEFLPTPRTHEVVVQAGQLLGELGMHQAVLKLIPKAGADRDRSLAVLRLGALAAAGNWEEMEQLLNSPDLPLPIPMKAIFKAGLAQSAGLEHEAPRLWSLAIGSARGNSKYLELLAVRAESWGAPEAAIAAWEELLRNPLQSARAARELLRLGAIWHHLPATSIALKRVIQIHPEEPRFRIQLALSQLMMEQEEDEAFRTLKELAPQWGDDPTFCVASALSALRNNSPLLAVEWISKPSIQWSNAPPVWRVIQAAALGQGFQRPAARKLAASIDVSRLSPPELELLQPWLPSAPSKR